MYATLIPLLADRYHLVAPDYPGFGRSDAPSAHPERVRAIIVQNAGGARGRAWPGRGHPQGVLEGSPSL
jgi:pimeloyl-ACP methyl ester carboxylesterase